jgi:phenylacetate-CoA ligase
MIWLRGMNVFPSAVEAVVRSFPELGDEYEIVVSGDRARPTMLVRAETRPGAGPDRCAGLDGRVREALVAAIRAAAGVELLPHGALPRADARVKTRRVRYREDA